MKDTSCLTAEMIIENEPSVQDIFRSGALETGWKDLDDMTGGFLPGELICVAGRHSMGSTGLVLSILNRVCVKEKKSCLYFSLAEDGRNLMSRLVANVSGNQAIFQPKYESQLKDTLGKVEKSPLYINEKAFFLKSIEKTCEKRIRKTTVDLVIIDYHQLIKTKRKEDSSIISVRLKRLARSMGCPVIVLCQLDPCIDLREDRRPLLSDLKSVGEMNHYADKILLLYREEYYNIDTDHTGVTEIFIAKNNYARRVGKVTLLHKGGGVFADAPKQNKLYCYRNDLCSMPGQSREGGRKAARGKRGKRFTSH
ncbi:MAG: hypothetical protein K6E16_08785 [Lachnospiraceae bacterium]|nr:hypothetical protein [Lachnospiraceae bacterium]